MCSCRNYQPTSFWKYCNSPLSIPFPAPFLPADGLRDVEITSCAKNATQIYPIGQSSTVWLFILIWYDRMRSFLQYRIPCMHFVCSNNKTKNKSNVDQVSISIRSLMRGDWRISSLQWKELKNISKCAISYNNFTIDSSGQLLSISIFVVVDLRCNHITRKNLYQQQRERFESAQHKRFHLYQFWIEEHHNIIEWIFNYHLQL